MMSTIPINQFVFVVLALSNDTFFQESLHVKLIEISNYMHFLCHRFYFAGFISSTLFFKVIIPLKRL